MVMPSNGGAGRDLTQAEAEGAERDPLGRKVMRMPSRPGQIQRKTLAPQDVINDLWSKANDKMRSDWLQIFTAILSSGGESTAQEIAAIADECYFEYYARSNPSKFNPAG